ncbi:MAG TPA: DUF6456 domain-containing protein [Mesorhizobium sp.]
MDIPASRRRILHFLSSGPASVRPASRDGSILLEATGRGTIAVDAAVLSSLASGGILVRASHSVALSGEGAALAARLASPSGVRQEQHRDIELVTVAMPEGPATVLANMAESPLAQLVRRKTRDGKPFLNSGEFQAGERLRADYTRGQIMPRLGANWTAGVSSGRRAAGGGVADLTDTALAARQRVDNALSAVGPELSGVLVDVCCFLKGLELVEAERGWPVRSAKIVLKTALGVLARHYSPADRTQNRGQRHPLHWGAQDYRPTIS